ncbi:transcriptional regulator [Flavobacterium sp. HXWNR69]|uniref:Transcriptional regulator n=1 Tax=Flavobacterium fragile TaxID=2949085 RepID=A0ABT0THQ2_9FLAO|nr:transcriptional regulator [Flavobacterium sp. HXWNR69]MCL9770504.1 transcriptional regulator [Flavobacterium sp. HXWNR69]
MNYIKHLTGFFEKVSADYDLNPTHISLYMAIFQLWNQNRFQNPISISRDELMRISKIASTATYHKCMKDLTEREYVIYKPSFNPFKGSILEVCNLDFYTKPVPKKELKKRATKSKNDQVIEQVNEQVTKQALNKHQTSSKHVPYINNINNTNIINIAKQENLKNEKKLIFTNSIFDEVQESDLKVEKEKEKKLREKKKKIEEAALSSRAQSRPPKPTLEEAQIYFLEKNFSEIEAQRFFNYFESNGWLVGGRTKMKDWKAAARNWMLNAKKFTKNQITDSALSSRAQSRESLLVPNHLHVTNQKNYGEAL